MAEHCAICGCRVHRDREYAKPTIKGRSHATAHHYVAERFFGRSKNRPREQRPPLFATCPWGLEGQSAIYCYECHEELLHNPVLTPSDLTRFRRLVEARGLSEWQKTEDRQALGERIKLFHEVVEAGLIALEAAGAQNLERREWATR